MLLDECPVDRRCIKCHCAKADDTRMWAMRSFLAVLCGFAGVVALAPEASARRVPCLAEEPACARLAVTALPETCGAESHVVEVRLPSWARFDRVEFYVDGRRTNTSRKRSFRVALECGRLKPGRHTVRVVALPRERAPWAVHRDAFVVAR
jgi:hypothetical protein